MPNIRKAIFPIGCHDAGFIGVPNTIPREMLPILDKPLIQFAIDEAMDSGIEEFIFVANRNKSIFSNYFVGGNEFGGAAIKLNGSNKSTKSSSGSTISGKATFVRQYVQRPIILQQFLGQAILCARHLIGDEQFAVLLPNTLIKADVPCIKQLINVANHSQSAIIAAEETRASRLSNYGPVALNGLDRKNADITDEIKRPASSSPAINHDNSCRYIFPSSIFKILQRQKSSPDETIHLADAIHQLSCIASVATHKIEGRSYKCGSNIGLIMANLTYALDNKDLHPELIDEFIRLNLRTSVDNLLDSNAMVEMEKLLMASANNS